MNIEEYMRQHEFTDEMLDACASSYEQGNFPHEDGPVHFGSHVGSVAFQKITVRIPTQDKEKIEAFAQSHGMHTGDVYREAVSRFLQSAL